MSSNSIIVLSESSDSESDVVMISKAHFRAKSKVVKKRVAKKHTVSTILKSCNDIDIKVQEFCKALDQHTNALARSRREIKTKNDDLKKLAEENSRLNRQIADLKATNDALSRGSSLGAVICNICLDDVKTLSDSGVYIYTSWCGHLICRPCFRMIPKISVDQRQCPCCREVLAKSDFHRIFI